MNEYLTALSKVWSGDFWSWWVMVLVVINYGTILFLFLWGPWVKIPTIEDGTTGHVWANGTLREGLKNLPKWWLLLSTAAFIAAFIYLVRYPGFGGAHEGSLKWTSWGQMHQQIAASTAKQAPLWERVQSQSVLALTKDPEAMRLGKRLFDDNCAACHGLDAKGVATIGAPNLTDNTWLFGGKVDDVVSSITNGRNGVMPAWEGQLRYGQIKNVANYVLSLSGASSDAAAAAAGKRVYDSTCAACHGADAKGNQMLGAPDLVDNIWKWGGSFDTVMTTIEKGRNGHMPAWQARLDPNEIHVLAAWVLSHGNTTEALAAGDK